MRWGALDSEEKQYSSRLRCNIGEGRCPIAFKEAMGVLIRSALHASSDIRGAEGTLLSPKSWPRRGLDVDLFEWRVKLSVPFRHRHINALEIRAALLGVLWALRDSSLIGSRVMFAVDSQVTIAVLTKGRSSAVTISSAVRKFAAVVLASSLSVYFVYVETSRNPADKPSRRDHA